MIPGAVESAFFRISALLAQVLSQAPPGSEGASGKGQMSFAPAGEHKADFQPYIFLAYGLVCVFLLLFTLWTHLETRQLGGKIEYLKDRFRRAHPETLDEPASS